MSAENESQHTAPASRIAGIYASKINQEAWALQQIVRKAKAVDLEYIIRACDAAAHVHQTDLEQAHADGDASRIVALSEAAAASINALLVILQDASEQAAALSRVVAQASEAVEGHVDDEL